MATFTEIEMAMFVKLSDYYEALIKAELQQANQEIPDFVGDDTHKQAFLTALDNLISDNEFKRAVIGEARDLLMAAIEALPEQTKIDLGIDHLFPTP